MVTDQYQYFSNCPPTPPLTQDNPNLLSVDFFELGEGQLRKCSDTDFDPLVTSVHPKISSVIVVIWFMG